MLSFSSIDAQAIKHAAEQAFCSNNITQYSSTPTHPDCEHRQHCKSLAMYAQWMLFAGLLQAKPY
jgi:hypothetical protein